MLGSRNIRSPLFRYIGPLVAAFLGLVPAHAIAGPKGSFGKNDSLRKRVGAEKVSIAQPASIARTVEKLKAAKKGERTVRILHLGDSHVASDYITGTVREALQQEFGNAGRGFVAIDQPFGYGGRRLQSNGFMKDRIVDKDRAGLPFGFSGECLESEKKGAKIAYRIFDDETRIRVYAHSQPEGGTVELSVDGKKVGSLETNASEVKALVRTYEIPGAKKGSKKPKPRELTIVALSPKARLYGISFERDEPGVFYDVIGPLGADAKVYTELEKKSFAEHLAAHAPDLVVLMVGGNDAMKIRKGWTDLAKVKREHEEVLDFLKKTLPEAECLMWSPMDAGEKEGKTIRSKTFLTDIRAMQEEIARAKGCAFWDMHKSMGGDGSAAKWVAAKVMNDDLVHPREKAAQLLGELFVASWMDLF